MQITLMNVLLFAGILVLLALVVAIIMGILILVDVRSVTREVSRKVKAAVEAIDLVGIVRKTIKTIFGK